MECAELRLLYAGNPTIAVPTLEALAERFTVVGVLTNPDKPSGRGRRVEMPPVKEKALALGIPVLQYDRLGREAREAAASLRPNFLLSFACGHYFGPKFLSLFDHGNANIHPSLLPKYRGSSPIQFALLDGERETGISIQRIASEIDSGNILAQKRLLLDGTETTQTLSDRVALEAAPLIVQTLSRICSGSIVEQVQDHQAASYCTMLTKADGIIDWNLSARSIHCKIRAMQPWPKASTLLDGVQLLITSVHGSVDEAGKETPPGDAVPGTVLGLVKKRGLAIACGDGVIHVDRLQLSQKKEMDSHSFVNGHPQIVGSILGS